MTETQLSDSNVHHVVSWLLFSGLDALKHQPLVPAITHVSVLRWRELCPSGCPQLQLSWHLPRAAWWAQKWQSVKCPVPSTYLQVQGEQWKKIMGCAVPRCLSSSKFLFFHPLHDDGEDLKLPISINIKGFDDIRSLLKVSLISKLLSTLKTVFAEKDFCSQKVR